MIEQYTTERGGVVVFWQTPKPDQEIIGEPAIVLKTYSDIIEIRQQGKTVVVTRSCVPEFIKAVQCAHKLE